MGFISGVNNELNVKPMEVGNRGFDLTGFLGNFIGQQGASSGFAKLGKLFASKSGAGAAASAAANSAAAGSSSATAGGAAAGGSAAGSSGAASAVAAL